MFVKHRLLFGVAASSGSSGQLSQITLPLLVGAAVVGLGMDEQAAGLLSSVELVTVALVSFVIAPQMGVWPRRNVALIGAGLAILGHACSTFAPLVLPLVAVAGGSILLGGALGPAIGGLLISWQGYTAIGGFILLAMAVVTTLAWRLQRHLDQGAPSAS